MGEIVSHETAQLAIVHAAGRFALNTARLVTEELAPERTAYPMRKRRFEGAVAHDGSKSIDVAVYDPPVIANRIFGIEDLASIGIAGKPVALAHIRHGSRQSSSEWQIFGSTEDPKATAVIVQGDTCDDLAYHADTDGQRRPFTIRLASPGEILMLEEAMRPGLPLTATTSAGELTASL